MVKQGTPVTLLAILWTSSIPHPRNTASTGPRFPLAFPKSLELAMRARKEVRNNPHSISAFDVC